MSLDDGLAPEAGTPPLPPDIDDLAELVDDAAKALSIGGTRDADEDMREAVDRLKRQLAETEEGAAG